MLVMLSFTSVVMLELTLTCFVLSGRPGLQGSVLAAGGSASSTAELSIYFPPYTGLTWTATGSLSTSRQNLQILRLPSGSILAAGGADTFFSASAELYTPAAGTWIPTGSLGVARSIFQMVLLPNGNVLAAGGQV